MKKHLLNKTLLRKLESKKPGKFRRTVEKKVRASLTEQARKLLKDLHTAELELTAMQAHASDEWLWLADIRHAGYLMSDVLQVLQKGTDATAPEDATKSLALFRPQEDLLSSMTSQETQ